MEKNTFIESMFDDYPKSLTQSRYFWRITILIVSSDDLFEHIISRSYYETDSSYDLNAEHDASD